jgi:hypothetical protein
LWWIAVLFLACCWRDRFCAEIPAAHRPGGRQCEPAERGGRGALTQKLEALEQASTRQLVVATVPDLQGYPIEDYGYKLGRAWGLGQAKANNGAILLVAPNERKVRIEVGYGLEPIMTDAYSSLIIQNQISPLQGRRHGGRDRGGRGFDHRAARRAAGSGRAESARCAAAGAVAKSAEQRPRRRIDFPADLLGLRLHVRHLADAPPRRARKAHRGAAACRSSSGARAWAVAAAGAAAALAAEEGVSAAASAAAAARSAAAALRGDGDALQRGRP